MGLLGSIWKAAWVAAEQEVKRVASGKRNVKPAAPKKRKPKKLPKMKRRSV
jgi:hypothetical protein